MEKIVYTASFVLLAILLGEIVEVLYLILLRGNKIAKALMQVLVIVTNALVSYLVYRTTNNTILSLSSAFFVGAYYAIIGNRLSQFFHAKFAPSEEMPKLPPFFLRLFMNITVTTFLGFWGYILAGGTASTLTIVLIVVIAITIILLIGYQLENLGKTDAEKMKDSIRKRMAQLNREGKGSHWD